MTDNQKFLTGVLLGVAAGVGIALLLTQTEKGKSLVQDLKDETNDLKDSLASKLSEFDESVNDLINKGKSVIDELEQKIKPNEV